MRHIQSSHKGRPRSGRLQFGWRGIDRTMLLLGRRRSPTKQCQPPTRGFGCRSLCGLLRSCGRFLQRSGIHQVTKKILLISKHKLLKGLSFVYSMMQKDELIPSVSDKNGYCVLCLETSLQIERLPSVCRLWSRRARPRSIAFLFSGGDSEEGTPNSFTSQSRGIML